MGADFWWQFVNKRVVDRVHRGPKRAMFRLQFGNFFFQLFDLISDDFLSSHAEQGPPSNIVQATGRSSASTPLQRLHSPGFVIDP
jgi:hypothetical protein